MNVIIVTYSLCCRVLSAPCNQHFTESHFCSQLYQVMLHFTESHFCSQLYQVMLHFTESHFWSQLYQVMLHFTESHFWSQLYQVMLHAVYFKEPYNTFYLLTRFTCMVWITILPEVWMSAARQHSIKLRKKLHPTLNLKSLLRYFAHCCPNVYKRWKDLNFGLDFRRQLRSESTMCEI